MRIGEKLKVVREARGITQEEIGAWLGMTQGHVAKIEAGTRNLHVDDLERVSAALGVSPSCFYLPEPWERIEAARSEYDAAVAEAMTILRRPQKSSEARPQKSPGNGNHADAADRPAPQDSASRAPARSPIGTTSLR